MNSVTSIRQVCDTLGLEDEDVKICCANRVRNRKLMEKYTISSVTSPNKRINFFTSKCFQGCNLFTNNGLIVVVSDANRESMVTDLTSDLVQIAAEYHNCFRNILVHIYSTKSNILSDEEFEEVMNDKLREANILISGNSKLSEEESKTMIERMNLANDVVTIENNRLAYSELKENYFRYWQELRKSYKNGISISGSYDKGFIVCKQDYLCEFEFKLAKKMVVSYQQLITLSNLKTLGYNKDKALEEIRKKKEIVAKLVKFECGKFYTNTEIKSILGVKATTIKEYFECKETKVDGKKGYRLESRKFSISI